MDCIFCKIINGEIPSRKIYEDEKTFVFLDIAGDVDGHMLVIPKNHVKNVIDADAETLKNVMNTIKKVTDHLVNNLGYDGVNILNASDESAGQTVYHLHFHIIPRKKDDGIDGWPKFGKAEKDLDKMQEFLKMN